jgi:uncharacterized protein with PIN domain
MLCPNCDREIEPESHDEEGSFLYQGKQVVIMDHFYRCPWCRVEWSKEWFDFAEKVYKKVKNP